MKKIGEKLLNFYDKYFYFFYTTIIIFYPLNKLVTLCDFLALFLIIRKVKREKINLWQELHLKKEWIIFTFVVISSIIFSTVPKESVHNFLSEYFRLMLIFFSTILFMKTKNDFKLFLYFQVAGNMIMNLPIIFYFTNSKILIKLDLLSENWKRFTSFNGSYTRLSFYYIFVITAIFISILKSKKIFLKKYFLYLCLFFLNLIGLFLTKTRITWIGISFGIFVISTIIILLKKKWKNTLVLSGIFIFCFLTSFYFSDTIKKRIVTIKTEILDDSGSFKYRIEFLRDINNLLKKELKLFGYGYSRKIYRYIHKKNPEINPENFIDPHNEIAQFYLEYGIIGIIAILWILLQIVKKCYVFLHTYDLRFYLSLYIIGILSAFCIISFMDHFFCKDTAKYFFIMFGMLNNALDSKNELFQNRTSCR